jgi:4-amino-4-deoxy-L-arabinose transferase-like glycosyltransferase
MGETLFGDENPSRDLLIEIVITAALAFVLPYCAIFFALSRLLGYLAEYMAQVAFYNRYLDIRDGQIEAKYMETVLREGYPPHRTAGLFGPLPQRFKGQNRANIARVVAGQYADTLETPAANLPPSSSASEEARGIAPTLRVKRLVLVVIAAAGLVAGGWFIFHMWHTHRNEVVSAKTISSPAPIAAPVVQRQPSPPATPVVQTQPVETQPVTTVTPVVAPTPPPVDTAALAREALEKNRQEEQQRIAQQRQKAIDQFKSLVADKTAELAKLQTGSVGQLDDNTNKITKAAWLRRSRLTRENEKARTIISRELQNQQKALSVVRESVQLVSSDPSASPKDVAGNIDLYNQIAAEVGQRITAALKAMDDDISGNAPNSGLIQVR